MNQVRYQICFGGHKLEIVCALCRSPNLVKLQQDTREFYAKEQRIQCLDCSLISSFDAKKIGYETGHLVIKAREYVI
jgi:hypothetical protein